ncbi:unnamed protein product [Pseudo-nitzschia multistriata]|uniref:Uncharacterized protein n=1 Tax=Pseudo-nitzschia multistriata TaxID=183589 RepID=A0A448Z150_9STRA|nr:unnamed protein product [Pseudo-nitzschia multistriata]
MPTPGYRSIKARKCSRRVLFDSSSVQPSVDDSDSDDWEDDASSSSSDSEISRRHRWSRQVTSRSLSAKNLQSSRGMYVSSRHMNYDGSLDGSNSMSNSNKRSDDSNNFDDDDIDIEIEGSDSDDESFLEQKQQDEKVKLKMVAILSTVVCLLLLMTAVGLGIALSKKKRRPSMTPSSNGLFDNNSSTFAPSSTPSSSLAPSVAMDTSSNTTTIGTMNVTLDDFDPIFLNETDGNVGANETSSPTQSTTIFTTDSPTLSPTTASPTKSPSNSPTQSPTRDPEMIIPDAVDLTPAGDTYVVILPDGEVYEKESATPTLLVRSRNSAGNNGASLITQQVNEDEILAGDGLPLDALSYALLHFDMADYKWYEDGNAELLSRKANAYLCLEHVPNTRENDAWGNPNDQKIFSACRVENPILEEDWLANPAFQAELTGYKMPEDCFGGEVNKTFVSPDTGEVCIDVSMFVDNYPPFAEVDPSDDFTSPDPDDEDLVETLGVRHRLLRPNRNKNMESTNETEAFSQSATPRVGGNYKNMLFMVAHIEPGVDASAEFYSRQDTDNAPKLYVTLETLTEAPTVAPTGSEYPSQHPTADATNDVTLGSSGGGGTIGAVDGNATMVPTSGSTTASSESAS